MAAEPNEPLRLAVLQSARTDGNWFSHLDASRLDAELGDRRVRDRCVLQHVRLHDGRRDAVVVVKIRHIATRTPGPPRRPTVVTTDPAPASEMARREFDGLAMAVEALSGASRDRFAVVRPLALLPEWSAVVMDRVDAQGLRPAVMAASRLLPTTQKVDLERAFANAGAWLSRYHTAAPREVTSTRTNRQEEIGSLLLDLCGFLGHHTGDRRFFDELARAGSERVIRLPEWLPVAVVHGDFALRNLFTDPTGRVSVIDPMPRWMVPPHEDITRFLVGLRLLGLQVTTQGLAFGANRVLRWQRQFLTGYGSGAPPADELETYQLMVTLDKWSAIVVRASTGGPRGRTAALRARAAHRYFRQEAELLVGRRYAKAADRGQGRMEAE